MTKGIFAIFTGTGKGKTTSALGHMVRALGHGKKVCLIQFIKGGWPTGEEKFISGLNDTIDMHVLGRGFTWKSDDISKDIELAQNAWDFAKNSIASNHYDLIILDELTYLVHYKMVDETEVINEICGRPENLHVIVTGRYATEKMIAAADLVTEMKSIKHPYEMGVKAQAGFDF